MSRSITTACTDIKAKSGKKPRNRVDIVTTLFRKNGAFSSPNPEKKATFA
jgi:hypothetical protein